MLLRCHFASIDCLRKRVTEFHWNGFTHPRCVWFGHGRTERTTWVCWTRTNSARFRTIVAFFPQPMKYRKTVKQDSVRQDSVRQDSFISSGAPTSWHVLLHNICDMCILDSLDSELCTLYVVDKRSFASSSGSLKECSRITYLYVNENHPLCNQLLFLNIIAHSNLFR